MRRVLFNGKKLELRDNFDWSIFEGVSWASRRFASHHEVARELENKNPYTITVLVEILNWKFARKNKYVKKTKRQIISKYKELLYAELFEEYGEEKGNLIYHDWLEKYDYKDDVIVTREMEPKYKEKILKRFKNHEKLFADRYTTDIDRRYNLSEPLNNIDYRNPYDNIFVWEESGKKVADRGGSGSSGARERNSKFIYGLLELSKKQKVPSYLFIYSDENKFWLVKKFDSLHVPNRDIGSNYWLENEESDKLKENGKFIDWKDTIKVESITIT